MSDEEHGDLLDSERGGFILNHKGYLYSRHSENADGSRTYWMCRRRPACKKRAITATPRGADSTVTVFKSVDHPSHPPDPAEAQALQAYTRMKRVADEHPEAPPAQILRTHMPDVSEVNA